MIKVLFLDVHKNKTGQVTGNHTHNCYELIYYKSGSGKTEINNTMYEFKPHTLSFVHPHTVHNELDMEYTEHCFIGFECDNATHIEEKLYEIKNHVTVEKILEQIFDEISSQRCHYEEMVSAKLQELLVLIVRSDCEDVANTKDLRYCMKYIEENYNLPIDFRALAEMYGYSYDYFRHLFKTTCGHAPQNYLIHQRLVNAAELLTTTRLNCSEVAEKCGFSNSAQFSSLFKRKFGVSPKNYGKVN